MSLKYLVFVGLFTLALNFEGHKFLRERYVMSRNAWNCSEVVGVETGEASWKTSW